jgi:hypothetical protein
MKTPPAGTPQKQNKLKAARFAGCAVPGEEKEEFCLAPDSLDFFPLGFQKIVVSFILS